MDDIRSIHEDVHVIEIHDEDIEKTVLSTIGKIQPNNGVVHYVPYGSYITVRVSKQRSIHGVEWYHIDIRTIYQKIIDVQNLVNIEQIVGFIQDIKDEHYSIHNYKEYDWDLIW